MCLGGRSGKHEGWGRLDWKLTRSRSGYRWVDHHSFTVEEEKEHIRRAIVSLKSLTGYAPRGWYHGRPSPRSRVLVPQMYAELGERLR